MLAALAVALLTPASHAGPAVTACVPAVTTCPEWSALYDGPASYSDMAMGSAMDRAGTRIFSAGYETYTSSSVAGILIGYDAASGSQLWKAEETGGLGTSVWSTVQSSADGGVVYVAGTTYTSEKCQVLVRAYDGRTGAVRWSAPQPVGPAPCEYYTKSVLSPDGRTYVVTTDTAVPAGSGKIRNGQTLAFDAKTGRRLWSARAAGATQNWHVTTSPDGRRVYVVGDILDGQGTAIAWRVYAYDLRTGRQQWAARYECARSFGSAAPVQETKSKYCLSQPGAVAATKDRVFITGSNGFGYATTQVAAFRATDGKALWHVDRDPLQSFLYLNEALVVTADGTGVVAGRVRIDPNVQQPPKFVLERFTAATGKTEWVQAVGANVHPESYCGGCGPVLGTDGKRQVYLTGAYPLGDSIALTGGLDLKSGAVAWQGQHLWTAPGASSQLPQSLNVAGDGRFVGVAGGVMNPVSAGAVFLACYDVATMVYKVPG